MKWSCVWLLVALLPLASATVFNWHRLGELADNVLRFKPSRERHADVDVDAETEQSESGQQAPPKFCNGLACPKFKVLKTEKTYQLRLYYATAWASTTSVGIDYREASKKDFMRLFDYISGANVKKTKIAMTAPVINRIIPGPGPACANNFTMSFFMAPKEGRPPKPSDKAVFLSKFPQMKVYVKSFSGFATKDKYLKEAVMLGQDLDKAGAKYHKMFYYTAGYDSPFKPFNRHNEIWFIAM